MLRAILPLSLAMPIAAFALPAPAQSLSAADRLVQDLLDQKQLATSDQVWLALPSPDPSARDLAVSDALSQALAARGIRVMGNVGLTPAPSAGGFQEQLTALKGLGVTKVVSVGPRDDLGNLTLRISEVPGGWLKSVRSANLGAGGGASAPVTATAGPAGEPVIPWNPRHGVGLQYSSLSGSGAAYRHWAANGWGVQIAGIPALSFAQNQTTGFVNLGLQVMSTFLKTDRLRLYSMFGVGGLYRPNETRYPDPQTPTSVSGAAWDVGLAPGLGVDVRIFDRILLTGALGYTFSRQSFAAQAPSYAYSPGLSVGTMIEW